MTMTSVPKVDPGQEGIRDGQRMATLILARLLDADLPVVFWSITAGEYRKPCIQGLLLKGDSPELERLSYQELAEWAKFLRADIETQPKPEYQRIRYRVDSSFQGIKVRIWTDIHEGFEPPESEGGDPS